MTMIQDMQSLDTALGAFLANSEYGIWRYCRTGTGHFLSGHGLLPGMTWDEFSFANRKTMLEEKIENLSYLGLVNSHLFPDYDRYETILGDYLDVLRRTAWQKPVMIPKSRAYPEGGNYSLLDEKLTEDIFYAIPDRFFDRISCRVKVIMTDQREEMFWQNLELNFDRKETISSWNGERLGRVSGDVTVVVAVSYIGNETYKGTVIPALMSMILRAWNEYRLLRGNPSYTWAGTSLGTGRYRNNIDALMTGSGDSRLRDMGRLMKEISETGRMKARPESISLPDVQPEGSDLPPVRAVEHAHGILTAAEGYRKLLELEGLLGRVIGGLEGLDPKEACEIWNRSVRQKVSSPDDIRALLVSKYVSVRDDLLAILSMRPVSCCRREYLTVF